MPNIHGNCSQCTRDPQASENTKVMLTGMLSSLGIQATFLRQTNDPARLSVRGHFLDLVEITQTLPRLLPVQRG